MKTECRYLVTWGWQNKGRLLALGLPHPLGLDAMRGKFRELFSTPADYQYCRAWRAPVAQYLEAVALAKRDPRFNHPEHR